MSSSGLSPFVWFSWKLMMGSLFVLMSFVLFGGAASSLERTSATTTTVVAFGDSTTARRGKLKVYADLLQDRLTQKSPTVRVINAGVGGHHTDLARKRFQKDVIARKPDVVIIQFGINDAAVDVWKKPPAKSPRVSLKRYETNLRYFITALKPTGARVILMTPNPPRWTPKLKQLYGKPPYKPDDAEGFNILLRPYAAVVRSVGKQSRIPVVDVMTAFEEYGKRDGQSVDALLLDGMHPNDRGHRLIADLLQHHLLKRNDD